LMDCCDQLRFDVERGRRVEEAGTLGTMDIVQATRRSAEIDFPMRGREVEKVRSPVLLTRGSRVRVPDGPPVNSRG